MTIIYYHYKGCGTCRKARKFLDLLDLGGASVEAVDLVAESPDAGTLEGLWRRSGLPLRRFFNTSGQSYRQGGFKDRLDAMSEAEQLAALAADGKLVKRPILDLGDAGVLVGFREAEWTAALAAQG